MVVGRLPFCSPHIFRGNYVCFYTSFKGALLRSCPNCRLMNDDGVGQCPGCGAPMSRQPNAPQDPNAHLYSLRANAGSPALVGQSGGLRPGSEPNYKDTAAVKQVALEVLGGWGA